jgi:hypothetical protein
MSFQEVITATKPGTGVQEDFIYNHLVRLMQNILTPLRDTLTTTISRQGAEGLLFNDQLYTNPRNIISWNWADYFYYLSLVGLQETAGFKDKFPNPSDSFELFLEYVTWGHNALIKPYSHENLTYPFILVLIKYLASARH